MSSGTCQVLHQFSTARPERSHGVEYLFLAWTQDGSFEESPWHP